VRSANVGGLEISAKIAEHGELKNFMRSAAAIKPDIFIDVGANLGLYTCILMKNRLVPRAILFEPPAKAGTKQYSRCPLAGMSGICVSLI
jgi:hypothetical protein